MAVTWATYTVASVLGGHFIIAWGAVLFGIAAFVRGLFQYLNSQD